MANEFKHKRYFRLINNEDSSKITFTSEEDAETKIGIRDVWKTTSHVSYTHLKLPTILHV